MQSVIDVLKQEKEATKKRSTDSRFMNRTRLVCEEDDFYLDKYFPFKRSHNKGEIDMKTLLSQFITLKPKEHSYMWCIGYGKNYIPEIKALLWHTKLG